MDFNEALRVDFDDIAAQLRAEERPRDRDQVAVGLLARIQKLNDVVVGAGNIRAGGVAVGAIVEL